MQKSWFAALGILCLSGPALAADINGTWLVADKTAVVKVGPCAAGLCGVLAWANAPATDKNNPDPKLRNRNIIGMQIFHMKSVSGRWEGEIYNAKDGKTYSGKVSLSSADAMRIEGCVMGFLCGGETWTRTKCDEPAAAAPAAAAPAGGTAAPRPASDKAAPKAAAAAPSLTAGLPLTGCKGTSQ